jgi:hypothetical protein
MWQRTTATGHWPATCCSVVAGPLAGIIALAWSIAAWQLPLDCVAPGPAAA